jgi:hypothetical protein
MERMAYSGSKTMISSFQIVSYQFSCYFVDPRHDIPLNILKPYAPALFLCKKKTKKPEKNSGEYSMIPTLPET